MRGRSAKGQHSRGDSAFTIVELLVVMGLMAVLAGITVGMLRKQDRGLIVEANARLVRSAFRLARSSARGSGSGALVRIDAEANTVATYPVEVAGNWHFEDFTGGRNRAVTHTGDIVDKGLLGRCLSLAGGSVDLGTSPMFNPSEGFRFSLWVAPETPGGVDLVRKENGFRLFLNEEGGLRAWLRVGSQAESVEASTRPGVVRAGAWSKVTLSYDRVALSVAVNDVVYAERNETRRVYSDTSGRLQIGGGQGGFKGLVDEARMDVISFGETDNVSPRIEFTEGSSLVARFDGRGRLDRRFHKEAVVVRMRVDETEEEEKEITIRIELSGVIR